MNVLRSALLLPLLGAALAAQANFINFDDLATTTNSGVSVGDSYLVSDGVSFLNGTALRSSTAPSAPNALFPDTATLTINSPSNVLITSVGLMYASTSVQTGATPTLNVYSGLSGAGTLLATFALADTGSSATYASVTLPFVGAARSFVLSDTASGRISYDNLSFTSQVQAAPEPATLAALGLGAAAMLRRRRKA